MLKLACVVVFWAILVDAISFNELHTKSLVTQTDEDPPRSVARSGGASVVRQVVVDAIFSHQFVDDAIAFTFATLEGEKSICRMLDFKLECKHPFEEFAGGNSVNHTDVQSPIYLDFSEADTILHAEDYVNYPDSQLYPMMASGVVVLFHIPGLHDLVLDANTISRIFRKCDMSHPECVAGSIHNWNHPDIKALNPEESWPFLDDAGEINVIVREDFSGTTEIMKRALSHFSKDFKDQIGNVSGSDDWPAVIADHVRYDEGVAGHVLDYPGSIGYISLGQEIHLEIDSAKFAHDPSHPEDAIHASWESVELAAMEKGLDLGNMPEDPDPSHLTADISNTLGRRTWPLVGYTYWMMRKQSLAAGAQCETRRKIVEFLIYFYEEELIEEHVKELGFSKIPALERHIIIDKLKHEILCKGETSYFDENPPIPVNVFGTPVLHEPLRLHEVTYNQIDTKALLSFEDENSLNGLLEKFEDKSHGTIALTHESLAEDLVEDVDDEVISIPFVGIGMAIMYNFCQVEDDDCPYADVDLVLDIEVTANILDLEITEWNHPSIQALNPGVTLPAEPIRVFSGPGADEFFHVFVQKVRHCCKSDFNHEGGNGSEQANYARMHTTILDTAFSVGYTPMSISLAHSAKLARLINNAGQAVAATPENIRHCAADTYDLEKHHFDLDDSEDPDCYPLVEAINLVTRKDYLASETDVALETTYFAEFIFSGKQITRPLADRLIGSLSDLDIEVGKGEYKNLATINHELLESINIDGVSILKVPHDLHLIPVAVTSLFLGIMGFLMFVCVYLICWTVYYRRRRLVRNSSPAFLVQILVGAIVMMLTIVPLSVQDWDVADKAVHEDEMEEGGTLAHTPTMDKACVAIPFLYSTGFFLTFSALFLKSWRLAKLFNNKKLRRLFISDSRLLGYQAVVIGFALVLNFTWVVTDPLRWDRLPLDFDQHSGLIIESHGVCQSPNAHISIIPLTLSIFLSLLYGCYLVYQSRRVPTDFSESKWIAFSIVMQLEAYVLGIPIVILSHQDPVAGYVIKCAIILLTSAGVVVFIFLPKLLLAYGFGDQDVNKIMRFVKKGETSGSGSNRTSQKKKLHGSRQVSSTNGSRSVQPTDMGSYKAMSPHSYIESEIDLAAAMRASAKANKQPSALKSYGSRLSTKLSKSSSKSSGGFSPAALVRKLSKEQNVSTYYSDAEIEEAIEEEERPQSVMEQIALSLKDVLTDSTELDQFIEFSETKLVAESPRFWKAVVEYEKEKNPLKRSKLGRGVVEDFILDGKYEILLQSETKDELVNKYLTSCDFEKERRKSGPARMSFYKKNKDNKDPMESIDTFHTAKREVFKDIQRSEALQEYLAKHNSD